MKNDVRLNEYKNILLILKRFDQQTINVLDVSLKIRRHFSRLLCTLREIECKIFFNSVRLVGFVIKHIAPLNIVSSISFDWDEVVYIITGIC